MCSAVAKKASSLLIRSGQNCQQKLQQASSCRHALVKRDGYAFPTTCLCAQASELMMANKCFCRKTSIIRYLRSFHPLVWAVDNCLSFSAYFCVSLQVTSLWESRLTSEVLLAFLSLIKNACCLVNFDCHFFLSKGFFSEMPHNFTVFLALRLKD